MRKLIGIFVILFVPLIFLSNSSLDQSFSKILKTYSLTTSERNIYDSSLENRSKLDTVSNKSSGLLKLISPLYDSISKNKIILADDVEVSPRFKKSEDLSIGNTKKIKLTKLINEELELKEVKVRLVAFEADVIRKKYYDARTKRIFREAAYHEKESFSISRKVILNNVENLKAIQDTCPKYKSYSDKIRCSDNLYFITNRNKVTLTPAVRKKSFNECEKLNLIPSARLSFDNIEDLKKKNTYLRDKIFIVPKTHLYSNKKSHFFSPDKGTLFEMKKESTLWISCYPKIDVINPIGASGQACDSDNFCINGCCHDGMCSEQVSRKGCNKKVGESCLSNNSCIVSEDVLVIDLVMKKNSRGIMKCSDQYMKKKTNLFCHNGKCIDITVASVQPYYSDKDKKNCNVDANPKYIKYFKTGQPSSEAELELYTP